MKEAVTPFVLMLLVAADLKARAEALEAVLLQVIGERDRALAELERLSQESLFAGTTA